MSLRASPRDRAASVTVRATDLPSSNSYTVRLAANSFAIGFNNNCLYGSKTVVVPSGSASHSATIPLTGVRCDLQHGNGDADAGNLDGRHGYSKGGSGGIVKRNGDAQPPRVSGTAHTLI